ncbi:peptide deformylase, mitochondrial-like [Oncorhynchus nerka]|uniref:peptide deformylase, mitochondrial-like n=1 Tax=Oncorhynchus nerka TaxID=8023 RepID=UPI001130FE0F|nr:peptide deformylase, mitochondrial-like [Oncorhynchus nerka]XP_029489979.1 peptide deformylase, mitochondrial-like [Oncorhynchus nerka]
MAPFHCLHWLGSPRLICGPFSVSTSVKVGDPVLRVQAAVVDPGTAQGPEAQEVIRTMVKVVQKFECLNEKAEPVTWQVSGWPARILQLEMDHLDGVRYIDRMDSKTFNVKWAAQNE